MTSPNAGITRRTVILARAAVASLGLLAAMAVQAATLPTGFTETVVQSPRANGSWNEAVGMTFTASGRMFVWERGGRVWIVDPANPVSTPFLDINDEVLGWRDHGMLGFALHPNFENTGYVYLMYMVDRNHLMNCDSPVDGAPVCRPEYIAADTWRPNEQYLNPPTNTRPNPGHNKATIGRIVRYQAVKPVGDADYRRATTVDYGSRRVLLGETSVDLPKSGGIPLTHESHGVGSLVFGQDGTLLVSVGDNASYSSADAGSAGETYWQSAVADGIIAAKENVGSYRSQMITSLAGKVLRLDPETGNGVASNPFYDTAEPRSAKSRVWSLGLRNPYRMTLRPGTGEHQPELGDPGVLYIGDVGWTDWEDLNIARGPRQNFGWPLYEGMNVDPAYQAQTVQNPDAPNPLANPPGCPANFRFRDLIKQETTGTLSFPNPCNVSQQIPPTIDVFEHTRPALEWGRGSSGANWGSFNAGGNAVVVPVGGTHNGRTVTGTPFGGNSSTGGVWYTGSDFPAEYRNTYFHADYGAQWIRNFVFDTNDTLLAVRDFATGAGGVVGLASHPQTGSLYYISWASTIRKVSYQPRQPRAVAQANPMYGSSPLTVNFSSAGSADPQGGPLGYLWDFGDGNQSTQANPTHTYTVAGDAGQNFFASLTVTDNESLTDQAFVVVSVNNTPPNVTVTSPAPGSTYSVEVPTTVSLAAQISDAESPNSALFCSWTLILHHNDHIHTDPAITDCATTVTLSPIGCDGEIYFFEAELTVTDPQGLSTSASAFIEPACTGAPTDTIAPSTPGNPNAQAVSPSRIDIGWSGSTDTGGSGLGGYRVYLSGTAEPIATVTTTSFVHMDLEPATTYSYVITAFDNAGNESTASEIASATTPATVTWSNQDIGAVGQAGSLTDNGSSLSVSGAGADIWNYADGFHFAHRSLTGDGEIIARIVSLSNTDPWAKAGVMLRESLAPGSRFALMLMTPGSNGAAFQYRTATNGAAAPSHSADNVSTLPRWLRLTREGNLIRGYLSADGVNWTLRSSVTLTLPATVYVGLAVTSHNTAALATAVFDNVSVTLPTPDTAAPSVPQNLTATASGTSQINLSWNASTDTGGSGLAGYRLYRNGSGTPLVTLGAATTAFADSGLDASTAYSYRVLAFDNAGNESDLSAQASATTGTPPPPDTVAPSVPQNLTATAVSGSRIDLAWNASTDNVGGSGLAGYRIYRNGSSTPLVTVTGTTHADIDLAPVTSYSYQVAAVDNAGNESALSSSASATTLQPPAWSNQDIGAVGQAGSLTDNGSSLSVSGAGADIWGSADAFHFAHRSLTGDGEIVARIVSLSNTDPWAKAGVMLRESLAPGSRFALMLMTPGSNGAAFQYRTTTSHPAAPSHSADNVSTLPRWLRLTREGNLIRGYLSADGVNWTLRSSVTLTLPATVYVGLAVTSHNTAALATAVFDNVSVTLPTPDTAAPSVPQNLTATASGTSQINLSWNASTDTGGSGLAGYRLYRNGSGTPLVTLGAATTAFADSGLDASTAYSYRVLAFDNAGNESDLSAQASATTGTPPPPDTVAPSVPQNLTATAVSGSRIDLAWNASTDNVGGSGLAGYRIYRNGSSTPLVTVTGTTHADIDLAPVTSYSYQVAAVDNAGNESALSSSASATTLQPPAWSNQDIGAVGQAGSLTDNGSSLSVSGAGADIWGSADAFHFAHRSLTGDGEIVARIVSLSNTDPWAKAGVMLRESLAPGSRFALMLMTPGSNGAAFQYRTTTSHPAAPSHSADNVSTLPRWLRLTREGNLIRGYLSADGVNWTLRSSVTLTLPDTVYVGLAVTSHNTAALATAVFDNISVTLPTPDTAAPSVPQNLTATASGTSQVNLSWSASTDTGGSGLAGYRLYRNGSGTPLVTLGAATTTFADSGLDASTAYSYRLLAFDNAGNESALSAQASATTDANPPADTTAPSVPQNLAAAASGTSQINLSWNASTDTGGSGLAGYRLYRNGSGTPLVTLGAATTAFADSGLDASTAYSYRVLAFDNAGNESDLSAQASATTGTPPPPDTVAPSVPQNLTATAVSGSRIDLAWNASTDNVGGSGLAGYRIYRNGSSTPLVTVTGTTHADIDLAPVTSYSYQVAAVDNAGNESALSSSASATTLQPPAWSNQDIGAVGQAGSLTDNGSSLSVSGAGADIWGSADAFHFAHRSLTGDGEIVARIVSLSNTDPWAKAGVMLRESLAPGSRFALMLMTPGSNGAAFQYRTTTSHPAAPSHSADNVSTLPRWLRLTREGNLIRGYLSADGVNWTLRSSVTLTLPDTVYVGLAVTSHNTAALATAVFDNVSVILPVADNTPPSVPAGLTATTQQRTTLGTAYPAAAGTKPHGIAAGDLNGDGHIDLVTADSDSETASVLLNNGSGSFTRVSAPALGSKPKAVTIVDLNRDGNPDLVTADQDSNDVSVLIGNGTGSFAARVPHAACAKAHDIDVGDFNGDGWPDVAVACHATTLVAVLLNDGSGSLLPAVTYSMGSSSRPHSLAIGDYNQDGNADIAVANYGINNVGILLGNGNGTFQSPVNYTTGTGPHSIRTADLNGDGRLDLAVANDQSETVSILLGNANGTFAARTDYAVGRVPKGVAIGDVNGDGIPDVLSANTGGNYPSCCVASGGDNISILIGKGDGTFHPRFEHTVGLTPFSAVVVDLNGDGRNDIATANWDAASAGITLSSGMEHTVILSWAASVDGESGVGGYRIYRNGAPTPIGTTAELSYADTGLAPSTTYTYRVSAIDRTNPPNESAQSTPITISTPVN